MQLCKKKKSTAAHRGTIWRHQSESNWENAPDFKLLRLINVIKSCQAIRNINIYFKKTCFFLEMSSRFIGPDEGEIDQSHF
jgi:hypothetical protein